MKQNYLKDWLSANNMSQVELAKIIGADKVNFNKVVNNKRELSIETAEKIAKVFNCHWSLLFEKKHQVSSIHGFIKKDCSVEFVNPVKHSPQTCTFTRPIQNIDDAIILEEVPYFGVHIFHRKPSDTPCWAVNLVEDTLTDKWFMAFRKNLETKDFNNFAQEYNYKDFYNKKDGLSIYKIADNDQSVIKTVKFKKSYRYYHIIATEYDVNYSQYKFHYRENL